MKDDEKKLGDFSRPESMAFPEDYPSTSEPVETQPIPPRPPSPHSPPPDPAPSSSAPPSPAPSKPVPASPSSAPIVDSWGGDQEDGWDRAPWDEEQSPEPGFQTPATAPASSQGDFDDPRHSDHERREGISPLLIGVILLILTLLSAAAWWWFMGRAPEGETTALKPSSSLLNPDPPPPVATPATEPPPKPDLPPLDASDPVLRSWLTSATQHPQLVEWLKPEDLARRFVATIDNISRGESPRPHLGVLEPEGSFEVQDQGGTVRAAPASSRRYDLLVDVFSSIDIAAGARLFHDVEPLLEEAYQDLGDPSRDFRSALTEAIDHLLAVPVPDQPPVLVKGVLTYRYADPELEALSPAAKHLLRLGPENARKVQVKLKFFRAALDLPE